jgi:membrane protein required for colicin V production
MIIDAIFFILMLLACYKGLRKGFIIALFSVLAFIIGLAAALKLSAVVAARISEHGGTGKWWPVISFLLVFIAFAFLVNICGRMIQKTFETVKLGWVNRIAGVLLFAVLYCIVLSVFLFYATQLHIIKPDTVASSNIYPFLEPVGPKIIDGFGTVIPWFKNIFSGLEQFFGSFSKPA